MKTSKASPSQMNTAEASSAVLLGEFSGILREVLGEYDLGEDVEITADTTFFGDLELESIDLVVLAGHVEARYGDGVNIAEFIATLEFDEIIGLTVGRLVDYVIDCLCLTRGLEPSAPNTGTTRP